MHENKIRDFIKERVSAKEIVIADKEKSGFKTRVIDKIKGKGIVILFSKI